MSHSPGHRKWPDHKVEEIHLDQHIRVKFKDKVVADATDVIRVEEDKHPVRYYFRREDVKSDIEPTDTTTECPFKGTASHFNLHVAGETLPDAVWSYEDPYDEHRDLKDRVAFYTDRIEELRVESAGR